MKYNERKYKTKVEAKLTMEMQRTDTIMKRCNIRKTNER